MFTGIIECLGKLERQTVTGSNLDLEFSSPISRELKIDQSLSHNGVCLTVTHQSQDKYSVTVVKESLDRSSLGNLQIGDQVNLERCLRVGDRLDGHFVQGHVDDVGEVLSIESENGSWMFEVGYNPIYKDHLVSKGSVTVNGVSLTVVEPTENSFKLAIIPYTFENTNFQFLKKGQKVNLEFDILGKYFLRQASWK